MSILIKTGFYLFMIIMMVLFFVLIKKRYPKSNLVFLVFMLIYRIPLIFIYYNFIPGDWIAYFNIASSDNFIQWKYSLGTDSIYYFIRPLIHIGLGPIDLFFIFSLFGYVGIALFYLIGHKLTNYTDNASVWGINIYPWVLLYPSLHMFSVMLGKDPIVLLAIGIAGYSLTFSNIHKFYLISGLLILLLVRPHIMFVLIACIAIALLWSYELGGLKKFVLFCFGIISLIVLLPISLKFFRVTDFSFEAIKYAIELNAGYGDDSGTFIDMTGYPLPLKMFTYLFRPLFIDAPNAMLLVYSLENLIFLLLTISILRVSFFQWITHQPRIIKFSLIFTILGTMVLSNGLSVFGLFMRQKTMVFLFLLLIIFAFIHHRNQKKIYRIKPANPDLPPSHA